MAPRVPSPVFGAGLVLTGLVLQEVGASFAVTLLPSVGPLGIVAYRLVFAAAVLWLLVRPRLRGHARASWGIAAAYGLVLGGMNVAFYFALERLPLGVTVTFEVLGPLVLSVIAGRTWLSALWAVAAFAGVALIGGDPGSDLDPWGIAIALLAAVLWAGYILMTKRTGERFEGLTGATLGMAIAGLVILPIAITTTGPVLFQAPHLLVGLGVAILSSAAPYGLEMIALRRLRASTFGVLLALAPAIAALAGLVILGQQLSVLAWAGIALVVIAGIGAVRAAPPSVTPEEPAAP